MTSLKIKHKQDGYKEFTIRTNQPVYEYQGDKKYVITVNFDALNPDDEWPKGTCSGPIVSCKSSQSHH